MEHGSALLRNCERVGDGIGSVLYLGNACGLTLLEKSLVARGPINRNLESQKVARSELKFGTHTTFNIRAYLYVMEVD